MATQLFFAPVYASQAIFSNTIAGLEAGINAWFQDAPNEFKRVAFINNLYDPDVNKYVAIFYYIDETPIPSPTTRNTIGSVPEGPNFG